MELKRNVVGWFEIPVADMERAMKFYEAVLGYELSRNQLGELDMAWFPWVDDKMGAGGSLVKHEMYVPNPNGVVIYFTAPEMNAQLEKVEPAGGKVIMPRKKISDEHGYMAIVEDTEGNRIALHTMIADA